MYRSVVSQQGRVTVEADANEAEEIHAAESRAELIDIIGPTGAPAGGFAISVPSPDPTPFDFAIGAGTIYVGGLRVRTAATTYVGQRANEWADYAAAPPVDDPTPATRTAPFRELVYLSLVEQDVCAVEDPALREIALGGPDTAARTRLLQRVRRMPSDGGTCDAAFAAAMKKLWSSSATLDPDTMRLVSTAKLKVGFTQPTQVADECQPTAQAGFLGAENQLIRVQVSGDDKLLWGYDNASFLYRVKVVDDKTLAVEGTPVDVFHYPRQNQWIEVLDVAVQLDGAARIAAPTGMVRQLAAAYDPTAKKLELTTSLLPAYQANRPMFVRVWESQQSFAADADTPVDLVDAGNVGIGVRVWTQGTARVPGDYWMIGVRPSVPEQLFPARLADFQPPDGPGRWAVPLATVSWRTGLTTADVVDCRRSFHDLVDDDDDLDFHNQHLHGWGVVCGLQVQCMPEHAGGESVIVRDGYAIDPYGKDIRLRSAAGDSITPVPLGALAETVLKRTEGKLADGTVSLWIDRDRNFGVDAYVPPGSTWERLLAGTILRDIYDDCMKPLVDFVRSEIAPGAGGGAPVSAQAKRLISLLNLCWELVNKTSGPNVFISAVEDRILRAFYDGMKALLQAKTFCAIFDDLAYPPYDIFRNLPAPPLGATTLPGIGPIAVAGPGVRPAIVDRPPIVREPPAAAPRPTTIFGTGNHTRLRVHPRRPLALTCGGTGGQLHIYDLAARAMIAAVDFPVAGAWVQDVAFAAAGNDSDVYAVALTGASHGDSTFAVGTIGADNVLHWTGAVTSCPGLRMISLATCAKSPQPGAVYAAARGAGLYRLNDGAAAPTQIAQFLATGHLAAGIGDAVLYAGAHSTSWSSVAFDQIVGVPLAPGVARRTFALPANGTAAGLGSDDLAVTPLDGTVDGLYAIIDGATGAKRLVAWNVAAAVPNQPPTAEHQPLAAERVIDLGESDVSRIAFSTSAKWAMVTYGNRCLGRAYRPRVHPAAQDTLEDGIHPLQIEASSIAVDGSGATFYVLEAISNTITVIPTRADPAAPWSSTVDPTLLATYRHDAIAAFVKMLGRLAQYLKDCACEHLLVDCPQPDSKKVYLADVCFRGGKVHQICNFHRRKYVHTFPTVEYWMSLVPILPAIKLAVERACCSVIAGLFDTHVPPLNADKKADVISTTLVHNALGYLADADLAARYKTAKAQIALAAGFGRTRLEQAVRRPSPGMIAAPATVLDVVEQPAAAATKIAAAKGVTVRNVIVADGNFDAVRAMITTPPAASGTSVDLVTDAGGKVIGWKPAAAVAAAAPDEIAALRRDLTTLTETHAKQLADMQQKLEAMSQALAARPHP